MSPSQYTPSHCQQQDRRLVRGSKCDSPCPPKFPLSLTWRRPRLSTGSVGPPGSATNVAPWVRVHKGRGIRFQTRLWVLGSTPKDKKIPQNGLQQTPWAYCCYTSRFGLSAAAATLFRTCAALSHDPCSENGRWLTWQYRMHARLSDRLKVHPRLTPVELQIHIYIHIYI